MLNFRIKAGPALVLMLVLCARFGNAASLEGSVISAGGGPVSTGTFVVFTSMGQGQPVGYSSSSNLQLNTGFLIPIGPAAVLPPGDNDSDGLPDAWELQYFGGLGETGSHDADGDGAGNADEYWAGTDPANPLSTFVMTALMPSAATNLALRWQSVEGKTYRLESAAAPGGTWTGRQSGLSATPPLNTYTVSVVSVREFWRVKVE